MPSRAKASNGKGPKSLKVVITGPFGAGKTTLIKTVSEIAVLSTEQKVTGGARKAKSNTTVAMDFGRITVDRELALYLFGTPGQKRFDFMWEILAEGMLGFIVLVDAQRDESHAEASDILHFFRDTARVPYIVAVNKSDDDPEGAVRTARERLEIPEGTRVIACNALEKESAKEILLELLYAVLDEIEATELARAGTS
jgi:uncharacterized protein